MSIFLYSIFHTTANLCYLDMFSEILKDILLLHLRCPYFFFKLNSSKSKLILAHFHPIDAKLPPTTMKKTPSRGGQSNLPVPKTSRGSPGSSKSVLNGRGSHSRSSEDIPRHVQLSYGIGGTKSPQRRAISPGNEARFTVADQGRQRSFINAKRPVYFICYWLTNT